MRVRVCSFVLLLFAVSVTGAVAQEVVLHSTDVTTIRGNWARVSDSSAASGQRMSSADRGWSSTSRAVGSPADYFEANFTVQAWTPYRIWLRARATNNSKWNESVWVQFGDSLNSSGSAAYRIGTTSGLLFNLEDCSGCGVSGWGWTGGAYWVSENSQVQFASAGTKTIRIQTREDGVQIDQIVLSPSRYLGSSPGRTTNDTTILPRSSGGGSGTSASSGAYGGTARAIPGTIQAEDFDLGSNGTGYRDNTSGNNGGQYRSTDVDIERTGDSSGSYNVGWIGSGEWLNFSVNVGSAGTYTLTARVASSGSGGNFHVEFNGVNKTGTMTVPNTGGWQSYRDVSATVSLSAGTQVMRVVFDSNGSNGAVGNLNYIRLTSGGSTSTTTGTRLRVMTWNIHFGKNTSNVLNLDAQARVMANSGADVILLQEASTWDGDQPNRFPELLRSLTGRTWYRVWSAHNGTSTGEGTLILSRLPLVSSSTANYYSRGFSRAAVSVNGVTIDIFNGHLAWEPLSTRTAQLNSWMSWMRNFSGPEIAGGDFNSWWGESWIRTMETEYSDTWQTVTGNEDGGYTLNNVRFDYLFRAYDSASRLTPTACWVISTSTSDHRPVVADYTVR
jgi:endonuclease/exonuclease/phosphatase family metal-dependent hydrolase